MAYRQQPPGHAGRPPPASGPIDVHELLKREAFARVPPGAASGRPIRPGSAPGVSDQYIVLDSFSKLRASDVGRGEFRWNFNVQGSTTDEALGVRDKVDAVIEVQLSAFSMPLLPEVPYVLAAPSEAPGGADRLLLLHNNTNFAGALGPTLDASQYPTAGPWTVAAPPPFSPWPGNPYSQTPHAGHFTIQLQEAGLQSFSDRNGARHHYEFTLAAPAYAGACSPTVMQALPLRGGMWDTYTFTTPLTDVHGLTLVFRNPDVPLRFLPDVLYDARLESDGAAAPGPFLRARAPGHALRAGDRVFVTGCASGCAALDGFVNRADGLVAAGDPAAPPLAPGTPIVLADPDVFYFDPGVGLAELVTMPTLPQYVTIGIASRRLRIPIRLRRVVGFVTNYETA